MEIINIKSKFGLRGVNRRSSLFVLFIITLLVSSSFLGVLVPKAEGQTATTQNTGDTYKITYILNGGIISGYPWTDSYRTGNIGNMKDIYSLPMSILDPVRHEYFPTNYDYEFLGWTVTYANGTQAHSQKSYVIPEGTTGDITLEAKWASKGFWLDIRDTAIGLGILVGVIVFIIIVLVVLRGMGQSILDGVEDRLK